MNCVHCGREIEDKFYSVQGELYCNKCVKEETQTIYYVEDEPYYEDDVEVWDIEDLEFEIKFISERLEELKLHKPSKWVIDKFKKQLKEYTEIYNKIVKKED